MKDSNIVHLVDKWCDEDVQDAKYLRHLFVRLGAKGKRFTKVDFRYSIFDTCYLRDCIFDTCDFTGCRFLGTNLHGASFSGCKFDYAAFERTPIDSAILETECPAYENLKMDFARSLRMNYQQLGDAAGVNMAINVELQATEIHLHKAWHSNESYYRKKYAGLKRARSLVEWLRFRALDFIWGNGESAWKFMRAGALLLVVIACVDAVAFRNPYAVQDYGKALLAAPQILFGTLTPSSYPTPYLTTIVCARIVALGFFMSILIKRLGRR
ncbi:MAG: pentapeptide repeat-containing protein [Pseudomonadota bacterium]